MSANLDQSLSRVRHAYTRLTSMPVWVPFAYCVSIHAAGYVKALSLSTVLMLGQVMKNAGFKTML